MNKEPHATIVPSPWGLKMCAKLNRVVLLTSLLRASAQAGFLVLMGWIVEDGLEDMWKLILAIGWLSGMFKLV